MLFRSNPPILILKLKRIHLAEKCLERLGRKKAKQVQPEFAAGGDEKAGDNTHIHTHTHTHCGS